MSSPERADRFAALMAAALERIAREKAADRPTAVSPDDAPSVPSVGQVYRDLIRDTG